MSAILPAPLLARSTAPALTDADLQAAFADLDGLAGFFGALAGRDTNGLSQTRWRQLSDNYRDTAERLRALLARGVLVFEDLPPGRSSGLLDDGRIAVDPLLDGRWQPASLPAEEEATAQQRRRDLLLPVLMAALARRLPPERWPWLADHLDVVDGLGQVAAQPLAWPWLARFFHAKDAYLRLALRRSAESDPAARQALARRQAEKFTTIRALRRDMAATFGFAPADRLQAEWTGYVAEVDGYAATRGWVLLDPALRRTQVGALARADADAVERAAAQMVAEAPRSAVAAARTGAGRERPAAQARQQAGQPAPRLSDIIAQQRKPDLQGLAERLPLASLALEPADVAAAGDMTAFRAIAARVKQALAGPDPRQLAAKTEAALQAAEAEAATLRSRVGALDTALESSAAESERLQADLAAARESLAAERRRNDALAAQQAAATRSGQAEAPSAMGTAPVAQVPAEAPATEQRPLYMAAGIALVLLIALLLWRGRRQRPAESVTAPRQLLSAPERAAASARPVIDIAAPESVWTAPRVKLNGGGLPPAPGARAAMKAGAVRAEAVRTAPGSETGTATHPMVQALRDGNLPLFEMLLGEASGLRAPRLQRIAYGGQGEDLVVVCRALDIDKLLFGSLFLLTDQLRGGDADEDPERAAEVLQMYDRLPPAVAREMLARWQHAAGEAAPMTGDARLG